MAENKQRWKTRETRIVHRGYYHYEAYVGRRIKYVVSTEQEARKALVDHITRQLEKDFKRRWHYIKQGSGGATMETREKLRAWTKLNREYKIYGTATHTATTVHTGAKHRAESIVGCLDVHEIRT